MPATIKATLKGDPRADKTHAVRIRVYTEKPARYHNTGIYILKKHWQTKPEPTYEKENWIKNTHHEHSTYNTAIKDLIDEFKELALKNPHLKAQELIDLYNAPKQEKQEKGFVAFAKEWIRRKEELGKIAAKNLYQDALNRYLEFTGKNPEDSKYLTILQITKFLVHMQKVRQYSVRTCNQTIQQLEKMYKEGILEGYIPPMGSPFKINFLTEIEEEKPRPEPDQIMALTNLPVKTPSEFHARNAILMLYFIGGARIGEALKLEWGKNIKPTHIEYLPQKRAKKVKRVKRHAGIDWVLSHYEPTGLFVFPYLTEQDLELNEEAFSKRIKSATATINRHFKDFAKALKFNINVSTKVLRRAYIDAGMEAAGDIRTAQHGVGHSSLKMTEIYAKNPLQKQIDEMNEKVYSNFAELKESGIPQENNFGKTALKRRNRKPKESGSTQ